MPSSAIVMMILSLRFRSLALSLAVLCGSSLAICIERIEVSPLSPSRGSTGLSSGKAEEGAPARPVSPEALARLGSILAQPHPIGLPGVKRSAALSREAGFAAGP